MGKKKELIGLGLIGAFAGDHAADGFEDDFEVEPEIVVEDVPGVQVDAFLVVDGVAAFGDLPEAGDAGLDGTVDAAVFTVVITKLLMYDRPGADDAHLPF